ncbi:importin-13 isoform X1 [Nasonia vitripennis]|uniref:Importin N-terminal domain-containing protein n=1 Tax=Nasonia vitripennis TaxID=7425 RepID=A0A7M7GB03_NASVI|nr:importin-13 isoform X1 [Nasonia vitripennis]
MDHATAVENAVKRFYASGDNDTHAWLLQAQASPEAWTFVWQLLDPSKPGEVQFFAATTLHAKISKQWEEVPNSEYLGLQVRVLEVLKHPGTSKIVLTRLCQALAAFMANSSMSQLENSEKCMVEELIEILPYNSPATVGLFLRVLEAIPREVNFHIFPFLFDRRQGVKQLKQRESILNNWCKAAWILQQIFSSCTQTNDNNSDALFLSGIECTLSWLKLGQLPLDTIGQIYPHLLLAAARYIPNRDNEEDDNARGWEVVQECLTMVVTHTELYKRPQLFWEWAKSFICMVKEHGAKYYYEILTTFGEAHSRTFLLSLANIGPNTEGQKWTAEQIKWTKDQQKLIAEQLIEFLLECSEQEGRYPVDEKRSCVPFGFWYALQDDLNTLDVAHEQQAILALKPIYSRLARALLKKTTLPASPSEAGTPDEIELLRCYRQDAADTLIYCYNVIGHDLLILLGQRLSQSHDNVSKWTEVESTIHAFKALSDNLNRKDFHYLTAIMDLMLSHIPYGMYPREVLCCACSAVGAYAEWIGECPEPWLERSLQLVVLGLTHGPITSPAASMALKDIVRECSAHLAPLAPSILETIGRTLPNVTPGGGEGLRLMYAAGELLKSLRTTEEQMSHLESTLGLCVMRLRELLQLPVNEARVAVSNQLKMISMFFTTLEGAICSPVLEALLPIFEGIVNHPDWSRDDSTLDAMYNCAQKSVSSLFYPEREAVSLLHLLDTSYKIRPHPAALVFLKQLVLVGGRNPAISDELIRVFGEISGLTLGGIASCRQANGNLSELSDLLEAYLLLLAQVCKKNARLLLQIPDQVPEMLRCGIACLLLPETATVKAAGCFLTNAIRQSPHMQTFIQPIGQELVCVILQCVGGVVPRNSLEPHAEVLLVLNKACPEWTAQWLRLALADRSAPVVPQPQKESFIQAVLRERTNKRRLCDKLSEFSLLCRQTATVGL